MSEVNIDLHMIKEEDSYSLAMMLLYMMKDNPRYSTLSELSYILDHNNFINFIKYYEGQTITIPTMKEVKVALRTLLLYQYYKVENIPWKEAIEKAGYEPDEVRSAERYLSYFIKSLDKYRIGGELYE